MLRPDSDSSDIPAVQWRCADGTPLACDEKRKILQQNLQEFTSVTRDLLEDAALMECDVEQLRTALIQIVGKLPLRYR